MNPTDAPIEPVVKEVRPIADGLEIDILVPAKLFYFRGHFPDRPVLPGVVQVAWAVALADRYLGLNIGSAQQFQVKFRAIIQPEESLTMSLRHTTDNRRLQFELRGERGVRSSGSIALPVDP